MAFVSSTSVLLALVAVLAAARAASPEFQQITSRVENMDVDKILNNARILNNYVKCLVEKGPCSPEGRDLQKILPELVRNVCADCSPKLRTTVKKTVNTLRTKFPQEWEVLYDKYDPKKERLDDLEKFLKS